VQQRQNEESRQPTLCTGNFEFAGAEFDLAALNGFAGAITESSVAGLDVGTLYEVGAGGELFSVGGARARSATNGTSSGFSYFGLSLSAGPIAGIQAGLILSPYLLGVTSKVTPGRLRQESERL
jgi:hypothetical protein